MALNFDVANIRNIFGERRMLTFIPIENFFCCIANNFHSNGWFGISYIKSTNNTLAKKACFFNGVEFFSHSIAVTSLQHFCTVFVDGVITIVNVYNHSAIVLNFDAVNIRYFFQTCFVLTQVQPQDKRSRSDK